MVRKNRQNMVSNLIYKDEVFSIVGAAIEVHKVLGHGYLESVYQEVLAIEMADLQIPFRAQKELYIIYKGKRIEKKFRVDFECFGKILVEIKARSELTGRETAQLLNYLKVAGIKVGLLINFGSHGKLKWKRFVNNA